MDGTVSGAGRPGMGPNPMMRALWEIFDGQWVGTMPWVEKIQPPDGMVVTLPDGTRWGVMAHQVGTAPAPDDEATRERVGHLQLTFDDLGAEPGPPAGADS